MSVIPTENSARLFIRERTSAPRFRATGGDIAPLGAWCSRRRFQRCFHLREKHALEFVVSGASFRRGRNSAFLCFNVPCSQTDVSAKCIPQCKPSVPRLSLEFDDVDQIGRQRCPSRKFRPRGLGNVRRNRRILCRDACPASPFLCSNLRPVHSSPGRRLT
jgi:hypothetical protein